VGGGEVELERGERGVFAEERVGGAFRKSEALESVFRRLRGAARRTSDVASRLCLRRTLAAAGDPLSCWTGPERFGDGILERDARDIV
jgi:hypothetical protein